MLSKKDIAILKEVFGEEGYQLIGIYEDEMSDIERETLEAIHEMLEKETEVQDYIEKHMRS